MNNRILVVSSTNRKGSRTRIVAEHYHQVLIGKGADVDFYSLEELPFDILTSNMYGERTEAFEEIITNKFEPADKYVFVMPEYNGGFPGVLKLLIDAIPPSTFHYKKAALVGVSSGHLGCVRGMDDFTNILNYIKCSVLYHKPKLSSIEDSLSDKDELVGKRALNSIMRQADEIMSF